MPRKRHSKPLPPRREPPDNVTRYKPVPPQAFEDAPPQGPPPPPPPPPQDDEPIGP